MTDHYFEQNGLTACCTDTTVILFWDKPAAAKAAETYTVLLDDTAAGTTCKTHYRLEGLRPETEYSLFVQWRGGGMGELTVRTTSTKHRLDVTAAPYFAVGDGRTMNTAALQKAVDDCGALDCVYFPAGVYLAGALRLHSNMELYLEEGAVLQGTADPADYLPRIHSRFEGTEMECYSSLLNLGQLDHTAGPNCENVILRGKGTIASGGRLLATRIIETEREALKEYLAQNAALVATCENADTIPGRVRPRLVNMSNCRNIWMEGLTFANGASWNLHMIYSDQIVTDYCTIKSDGVWNGDGWDPDSSTYCTLFACQFCTGDDAVAIKSGKNPEGNAINRPTKHIRVFDCHSDFGHGICIGSEMSGGVEDVKIWDCDMAVSTSGLEIKATKKRGGYVRDVEVRDCTLSHVMVHSVGYNDDGIGSPVPPVLEDFRYERVTLLGRYIDHDHQWHACPAIELKGFDVPGYEVKKVRFKDVVLEDNGGPAQNIQMQHCKDVSFENITVQSGAQPE